VEGAAVRDRGLRGQEGLVVEATPTTPSKAPTEEAVPPESAVPEPVAPTFVSLSV
jgi:hypothetical protein